MLVLPQELRLLQRDYVVEVYTQAAYGISHSNDGRHQRIDRQEYVKRLATNIGPHMVLLADMDLLWTFNQMMTTDVFVHSKSTLSIAAGILHPQVGGRCGSRQESLVWGEQWIICGCPAGLGRIMHTCTHTQQTLH